MPPSLYPIHPPTTATKQSSSKTPPVTMLSQRWRQEHHHHHQLLPTERVSLRENVYISSSSSDHLQSERSSSSSSNLDHHSLDHHSLDHLSLSRFPSPPRNLHLQTVVVVTSMSLRLAHSSSVNSHWLLSKKHPNLLSTVHHSHLVAVQPQCFHETS